MHPVTSISEVYAEWRDVRFRELAGLVPHQYRVTAAGFAPKTINAPSARDAAVLFARIRRVPPSVFGRIEVAPFRPTPLAEAGSRRFLDAIGR